MLNTLAVSGYRSLRELIVPLERLNLVTGPNGSGKSNLYRALRLLAETAQGRVIQSLAREGGLQRSQVVVVSHAPTLVDGLQQLPECHSIALEKRLGQTLLAGDEERYARWEWPAR
jgi:predicted ATPase